MPCSQNAMFRCASPEDSEFLSPGRTLLRAIAVGLRAEGWSVSELELWRDCGWSFECGRADATMKVVLANAERELWILQCAPIRVPRLFNLFSRKASATAHEVLELARAIHALIAKFEGCTDIQWQWDGMPKPGRSTSQPCEPSAG
jgi:hypothetical protein